MTKLSVSVVALVVLMHITTLIAPSEGQVISGGGWKARRDPWDKQVLPPQPRPGYYRYLGDCIDTLTKQCGLEIFDYIYGKAAIDIPCCKNLKAMGQLCSKSLSLTLSQIEKFKPDAALIITKSNEAYDKCVKIAGKAGGS